MPRGERWLVVSMLVLLAGLCGEATAQTARGTPPVYGAERIVREWALRGVVISDRGRSAVLEHLPSGRQELVNVGVALAPSLAVVAIEHDRVALDTQGGPRLTLRLGHGGREQGFRRPVTVARRLPPSTVGRRRGR